MKIKLESLAQYKHVKFLSVTEKQAMVAYRVVMAKLMADLRKVLKRNKLAKSDSLEKAPRERKPGKSMVGAIYVHRSYEHTLPQQELARAKALLGDFKYDIIKHNKKSGAFSFIQSPDFDTAHEPIVGNSKLVTTEGAVKDIKAPNDPWIYHHKWQFVGDDYKGFDVNESKARSEAWQAVPGVDRSRIGKLSFWNQNVVPKLAKGAKASQSPKNRLFGLKKSDETPKDGLDSGWTAEVPTVEVDLSALANKTISKHLDALRWVLMGDFAGKEASKAAAAVGLKGRVTPGIIQAAYLHSLDSHGRHYEATTKSDAPGIPEDLLKASMDQINKRVQRFVEQSLSQLKLDLDEAVNRSIAEHNFKMLNAAHKGAHELLPEVGSTEAVAEAGDGASEMLRIKDVLAEVSAATGRFETKWDLSVRSDLAIASAAGTHQAMLEIHGRDNKDLRVAWIMMQDERTCSFCHAASRKPDGSYKYYKISDFEPSGYNYGKKKADWKLCIPPAHPRCRCQLVFIPPGFEVDKDGGLVSR